MAAISTRPSSGAQRRAPSQRRSRERVERILDATAELVLEHGVKALGTRAIADRAGVPVASLYQYFADKEELVLELVKRDTAEMDAHVVATVAALDTFSVRSIVTATMNAYIEVYARRKEFVAIYFQGRANAAVMAFCRDHNLQTAKTLYDVMAPAGLLGPDADLARGVLAVELGDRVFELAFRDGFTGDQRVIDDGIEIVVRYLEQFATEAGITGVSPPG